MTEFIEFKDAMSNPIVGRVLIVGIDPGVTTGVACLWFDEDHINVSSALAATGFQVSTGGSGQIEDFIGSGPLATARACDIIGESITRFAIESLEVWIAIENFELRSKTMDKSLLSPVLLTGGIVQVLAPLIETEKWNLKFQTASSAKTICTNERIKKWHGFHLKRERRHLLDAMRHATLVSRSLMAS